MQTKCIALWARLTVYMYISVHLSGKKFNAFFLLSRFYPWVILLSISFFSGTLDALYIFCLFSMEFLFISLEQFCLLSFSIAIHLPPICVGDDGIAWYCCCCCCADESMIFFSIYFHFKFLWKLIDSHRDVLCNILGNCVTVSLHMILLKMCFFFLAKFRGLLKVNLKMA